MKNQGVCRLSTKTYPLEKTNQKKNGFDLRHQKRKTNKNRTKNQFFFGPVFTTLQKTNKKTNNFLFVFIWWNGTMLAFSSWRNFFSEKKTRAPELTPRPRRPGISQESPPPPKREVGGCWRCPPVYFSSWRVTPKK